MIKPRKCGLNYGFYFVRLDLQCFAELYGFHSKTVKLTVKRKNFENFPFVIYGFTVLRLRFTVTVTVTVRLRSTMPTVTRGMAQPAFVC